MVRVGGLSGVYRVAAVYNRVVGSQVAYDDHYEYDEDPTGEEVSDYDEEYTTPDVLPVFTSKEQHFSVEVGGDITFPCQLENQGAHVVMFKHIHLDGEHRLLFVGAMALKQTIKLTKDGNSFKLSGVRRSHAGSYVCRVETSPAIEVTHTLDVQYPAKVRRVSQEVQQVIQAPASLWNAWQMATRPPPSAGVGSMDTFPPAPNQKRQGTKPCPAAHLPEGSTRHAARPPTALQHRRDVAGLCVTYKILKQGAPHLAILRQPWATPHPYSTRDANKRDQQLIVPFARTATFFRSFLPRYSRLWNRVVRQTDMHQAATLHIFKCAGLSITLGDVDRHVEGTYICTASNGLGRPSSASMTIKVKYPPEIITEQAILHTGAGDEAKLVCIVHGRPSPTVTWTRGGHAINTDRHISSHDGLHRHALTVKDVKDDDFGDYTCTATSPLGRTNSSLRLTGLPRMPRLTSSPAGGEKSSYTLTWETDSYTPVIMYRLQYRKLNDNRVSQATGPWNIKLLSTGSTTGPAVAPLSSGPAQYMSHAITHLEPATDYEATVAVENKFGWSSESQIFHFYTRKEVAVGQSASGGGALCVAPTLVAAVVVLALPLLS
ncbi:Protein amalgam [Chionoecetes opilio]|uniref:Protein amalgam n=1 Tax=Chionoecetes opilio TaxID=41210 RepID=A0A8J4XV39_CHIOP|nr:Protein amalgam [Chionoecetes opilio]